MGSRTDKIADNPLVKIYTRTGDSGETGLFDGQRVLKSDLRVDAYGEVDELNAALGLVLAEPLDEDIAEMLRAIQRDLFAVGGRLADPSRTIAPRVEKVLLGAAEIARLEGWIDRLDSELPPLRRFILPGGSRAGAAAALRPHRLPPGRAPHRPHRPRRPRPGIDRVHQPAVRLPLRRRPGRQPARGHSRD